MCVKIDERAAAHGEWEVIGEVTVSDETACRETVFVVDNVKVELSADEDVRCVPVDLSCCRVDCFRHGVNVRRS